MTAEITSDYKLTTSEDRVKVRAKFVPIMYNVELKITNNIPNAIIIPPFHFLFLIVLNEIHKAVLHMQT